ncbi:hypothetical protein DFJ74DRAFT_732320 [Hyaloraphidium curvatum]|nr:hypothetical protein DFJ74DRAFT_732320 [Hyaloraphidium curvatum]
MRAHLRAAAAAAILLVAAATGASGQCTRDSFPTGPGGAAFPAAALPAGDVPAGAGTTGRPITQNHWSEVAVLARPPRRAAIPPWDAAGCPHLAQNLLDWHSPTTWGGAVPRSGDVVLPQNARVLVSSCSIAATAANGSNTVFGTITVPASSELIFGDAAISIRARGFRVLGALRAGGPRCRLRSRVSITLHGSRNAQPLFPVPDPSVKGIHVDNGSISVHGTLYTPTWTRLAATARAGDTVLLIQDVPNWRPGQRIVVTTTDLKDARDFHRNEVLTIAAVFRTSLGDNVGAVRVTAPLAFTHYGGPEYQAEVALLSRDILIQGDEVSSEPTDTTPLACTDSSGSSYPCEDKFRNGFGGHVMVSGSRSSANVSGVEFFRMGQTNVLGRYPLHFHLMGSQEGRAVGAVATDCSVHRSFFRCFAVHGTDFARLHENTAYDATGHCFFLEDGVEENNELHYNFGAHVHTIGPAVIPFLDTFYQQFSAWVDEDPSNLILPSDVSASVFYAANLHNSWLGNAASGGWAGFGFPSLARPVRAFALVSDMSPRSRPFILFRGNSAHSSGFWFNSAGGIYVGGQLSYKGAWGSSLLTYTPGRSDARSTCSDKTVGTIPGYAYCGPEQQLWLRFEDTKVFLSNRGMQHWGDRSDIVRFELADINLAANVFGEVGVRDVLHTCRTGNKPTWFAGCPRVGSPNPGVQWGLCHARDYVFWHRFHGWQWYDVGQRHIITDVVFRNCRSDWDGPCVYTSEYNSCGFNSMWIMLTHSDEFVPEVMQATRNITYQNVLVPELVQFSTSLSDPMGNTVSGRLASWFDADGSVYGPYLPSLRGRPVMIGSTWARGWWRMNPRCVDVASAGVGLSRERLFACPMGPGDTTASVILFYDQPLQSRIGSSLCMNGNWDGDKPCPVAATATHFGRAESDGLLVGVNSKITGPVMPDSGGWFVRFDGGTPSTLAIAGVVMTANTTLAMAFPYPPGTQFSVSASVGWCDPNGTRCTQPFRPVGSVDEVRRSLGDTYHFDGRVLYVRVVFRRGSLGSLGSTSPWTEPPPTELFVRNGLELPLGDYADIKQLPEDASTNYWISIRATSCPSGGRCPPQNGTAVPPAVSSPGTFCASPNSAIPELGEVSSDVVVPQQGTGVVADVDVQIFWTHTWPGDVSAVLQRASDGRSIDLFHRFSPDCTTPQTYGTVFDDSASGQFTCSPPATARPASALSAFAGQQAAGTWRLTLRDTEANDGGTLSRWCLSFSFSQQRSSTTATASRTATRTSATQTRSLTQTKSLTRSTSLTATATRTNSLTKTTSRTTSSTSATTTRLGTFCATPNVPLPDLGTATSDIFVPSGIGAISDVDVQLFWTHTWPSDVSGSLTRMANGRNVSLFGRLDGCNTTRTYSTLFDDSAAGPFTCVPAATARPAGSLSTFRGLEAGGAWRVALTDWESQDGPGHVVCEQDCDQELHAVD